MSQGFIVIYDDEQGLCCPMGWDADCPDALSVRGKGDPVAYFSDRASARKAIAISRTYARLQQQIGMPANDDFLDKTTRKCVRVLRLKGGA